MWHANGMVVMWWTFTYPEAMRHLDPLRDIDIARVS